VITDPGAVRILCFGDSNTHGAPSDDPEYVRLGPDQRWTGRLQGILGDGFEIIEEGLSGRTTDVDYDDRRGRTPAIVLVSPILIDEAAPRYEEMTADSFDSAGVARSRELGTAMARVASERRAAYADAATVARAGDDGLHLTRDSHARLADLVAATLASVLSH
jgi:lysophospholipase L1-like esterase